MVNSITGSLGNAPLAISGLTFASVGAHRVLLDAVRERIGADNFITGHRSVAVEQDEESVTSRGK
jgi:hypothetical protein